MPRARQLSLYGGVVIVSLWTLIRHITNGVNYDVVGQIGLVDQWVHGLSGGAYVGTTNYILKMPAYVAVNTVHFLSPINRLLLLALTFNVVTFMLLFKLAEKILALYAIKDYSWLYLGMLWLATIAGSVFWVDYANSRNLEAVGGVLFLYFVLKYNLNKRVTSLIAIAITASIAFFADPLQLYVFGFGVCLYVVTRWLTNRDRGAFTDMLSIIGATATGYIGSKLLFLLAKILLPISFLAVPNSRPELTSSNVVDSIRVLGDNTLRIFDINPFKRPYGFNSVRETLNMFVVAGIVLLIIKVLASNKKNSYPLGLVLSAVVANIAVYLASGQALKQGTSRYLFMLPILAIIFVAFMAPSEIADKRLWLRRAWLAIILMSSVLLAGALVVSWPARHSKDQHIGLTVSYLRENNFRYALSSREVGVTSTYFSEGQATVLPLACSSDHKLRIDNLFYDKGAFNGLNTYTGEVPIILQANSIRFGAFYCDKAGLISQFGQPKREQAIPGIGTAEIYDAFRIKVTE